MASHYRTKAARNRHDALIRQQRRARGECVLCFKPMPDSDPRLAHSDCWRVRNIRDGKIAATAKRYRVAALVLFLLGLSLPLAAQTPPHRMLVLWPDLPAARGVPFWADDVPCRQLPDDPYPTRLDAFDDAFKAAVQANDGSAEVTWTSASGLFCELGPLFPSDAPAYFTWTLMADARETPTGFLPVEVYARGTFGQPPPANAPTVVYSKLPVCQGIPLRAVPPDSSLGWRAQFRHGTNSFQPNGTIQESFVNLGLRDESPPYLRTVTLPVGTYHFSVLWTKLDGTERPSLWQTWSCK